MLKVQISDTKSFERAAVIAAAKFSPASASLPILENIHREDALRTDYV